MDTKSSNKEEGISTVTFEKCLHFSKQLERKFVLKPLTKELFIHAGHLVTEAFCKENPFLHKVSRSFFSKFVSYPLTHYAANEQVGVVCIEVSTGEIVGVHLGEDYVRIDPPYVLPLDERPTIYDLAIKDVQYLFDKVPRGKFETIWFFDVALRSDVEDLGIFDELVKFMVFEHPILKKAKVLVIDAIHPDRLRHLEQIGFTTIWHKKFADFKDIPGYENFAKFKEDGELGYSILMMDRTKTILPDKNIKPKL